MGGSFDGLGADYRPEAVGGRRPAAAEGDVTKRVNMASGIDHVGVVAPEVDARVLFPEQRLAVAEAATTSEDPGCSRQDLDDDFSGWFREPGKGLIIKAAHSVCGRLWEDMAFESAMKIYRQWPDPRKRKLFKTTRWYVYKTVKNVFLDYLKKDSRRGGPECELPGEEDTPEFWRRLALTDPGWEVRLAVQRLADDEGVLIFLRYWGRMSLSAVAREMHITRGKAERLHKKALDDLKVMLAEG